MSSSQTDGLDRKMLRRTREHRKATHGSTLCRVRRRRPIRAVPAYTRRTLEPDEVYVAYRIVVLGDPGNAAFPDSFRSRAELGLRPRGWMGENQELAEGLSAFKTLSAATGTAARFRRKGRDLGEFVAELRLSAGQGFEIAEHGAHGHLTLWGDPLMLALQVVDIVPVPPVED